MAALWNAAQMPDLTGRMAVVTGGNSGLGWETALELTRHGAHVVIACRSPERAKDAVERLRSAHAGARVEAMALDLASLASIRSFTESFAERFPKLDLLVNNAGVMAIPRSTTADGFEMQIGTNHLGHFALTGLLLGPLLAAATPRVVTVSSVMHRRGRIALDDLQGEKRYAKMAAYGQSKLANLLFMFELARRATAAKKPLISVAAHPGYAATNLQTAGPRLEGSSFGEWIYNLGNTLLAQTAAQGALPSLYAATASEVVSGEYFGPTGLLELWGAPTRARRTAAAQDPTVAKALWELSVKLTGVDYAALSG
jgi:NAD(P)-dependent dehydrogenase (short-subunit alcohol dehydrogenase family)